MRSKVASAGGKGIGLAGRADDPEHAEPLRLVAPDQMEAGQVVRLAVRVTNGGPGAVKGLFCLCSPTMRRIHGGIWPHPLAKDAPLPWGRGFVDHAGPHRRPSHYDGTLLLDAGRGSADERVSVNHVGYNVGLVAMKRELAIEAGATAELSILLFSLDAGAQKPGTLDLSRALDDIKGGQ